MPIIRTHSAQLIGLDSHIVTVEIDISNGLHSFSIVGLGDRSVDEAKDRISAAIKNSGFVSPKQKNHKVTISLAPAYIKKVGPSFDLAMALAYLGACGDVELKDGAALFLGELSLDGQVRRVSGVLPIVHQATKQGFTSVYIPQDNVREASWAQGIRIYGVTHVSELVAHLKGEHQIVPARPATSQSNTNEYAHDISLVRGNTAAKRALEIAAAGAHNAIMCGPPGTGKTMLARSFHSLLPPLGYTHAIEVTSIYSAAHTMPDDLITMPPFRAPHHTASYPAIIGGGSFPKPGEITLAHRGVLFMDELPEFGRDVIEALRQPLEDRRVTISRAQGSLTFPAQCILIGAMNPCPCGKGKHTGCRCAERVVQSYWNKLSGPILDRIDIWIPVEKIDYQQLSTPTADTENSTTIRTRVVRARARQEQRCRRLGIDVCLNSEMSPRELKTAVSMTPEARVLLQISAQRLGLSGRAFHRIMKVAQTIADLADDDTITKEYVLEALQYRPNLY